MYKIELETTKGKKIGVIDFPTMASEVKYSTFMKFEKAYQKKEDWLAKMQKKGITPSRLTYKIGYIKHVLRIVQEFVGDDRVEGLPVGDYIQSLKEFFGVDDIRKVDFDQAEASLFVIYRQIWRTMETYEKAVFDKESASCYKFKHKGLTWTLPGTYRDAITGNIRFNEVSAAAAIEALDAARVYNENKGNDVKGAFMFSTVLKLIACFSKNEGQEFPTLENEIQRYISTQMKFFESIDMQTALNVRDFFLYTPKALNQTRNLNIFLKSLKEALRAELPSLNRNKNAKIFRRLNE